MIQSSQNVDRLSCEDNDIQSMTTTERRFAIDLVIARGLSFTRAKLLDLTWDIGIGQGGRLIHGWILYHVATRTVTWILEYSALTYPVLLAMLFSPDSAYSLWTLVISLGKKQRGGTLLRLTFLAYSIAYVLIFATVWSAATGYQSPSTASYTMPDLSWANIDHDELRLCWSVEAQKFGGDPWMNSIVPGPQLGAVVGSFENLKRFGSDTFGPTITSYLYEEPRNKDFLNMSNYHDTKDLILSTFGSRVKLEKDLNSSSSNDTGLYPTDSTGDEGRYDSPIPADGWQFLALYPNTTTPQIIPWVNMSQFYLNWMSKPENKTKDDMVYELFGLEPAVRGVVYYRSMFLFKEDNTTMMLDTPFLNYAKSCSWWTDSHELGKCVCWRGNPLTKDFRMENNLNFGCANGQGYIWGFSRSITLVGVIMEFIWCLVCVRLWASTERSEFLKHGRPTYGTMRSILDISEAVSRELGDKSCLYTEARLMKKLETCLPVSYAVSDGGGGIGHVGLVAVPEGLTAKRRVHLDEEKYYG
ncbi:hypothetical protein B0H67DRAFT_587180 [Lasiosphaeris hirsuta]|uniref:Uncharacterized protein n=1 Tax=Lasiosphaeris hirsuta TaxID=260670 RepID=A0AA40A0Y9_9PEZI|nr:hypothetical protein B0H67DRAFT_587180 [Lasiosphaeris hirsuta]